MKNNITKLTIVFISILALSGCSDYLESESKSAWKEENFYSNKQQANIAIAGIYSQLSNDQLYGNSFNVLIEGGTDETYTSDGGPTWDEAKYNFNSSSVPIKNAWLNFYSCIHLVNQFEKNLKPSIYSTVEEYNSVLAKAYFMRAFCYFNLANWFGPVPLRLTPVTSQKDNILAASPVLEVYQQVEKDFLFAAEHLVHANNAKYLPGEPNKMAAHGMLARLYLKMGGYQPYLSPVEANCYLPNNQQYFKKAQDQCEIVINDGWHQLNPSYRAHFLTYLQDKYDLKESLFEISFGNLEATGLHVSGRLGNINGVRFFGTADIPRGFCKINASQMLYNKYPSEDLRRTWNIAGFANNYTTSTSSYTMTYFFDNPLNQYYAPGKFRRWEPKNLDELIVATRLTNAEYVILNNTTGSATDPNFTSINFPILRYSDILLMHAEACIGGKEGTLDASDKAINSLNLVRLRAGLDEYSGSLAHKDFFDEIVDERLRELCFEGLRKQDLIRWNLLEKKLAENNLAIKASATYSDSNVFHQTYLAAGKNFDKTKHLLLPYPIQETQLNTALIPR
ncbi:RagB/SusD family nutrient uptake outer membrane protein [Flavobacterium nackdongense]|uniref:RagB/SusD family nutrient uptake outer membrane protein n=1 Tax=Flavobacterium nackdongense TaxID=2547394 RepID=A0A4P6YB53_9FLAO|nr:RagB/SusD family nutrient uptake outer membrane protein [Flavobacterium nackdongense]QBN17877.1 RagB/SusD family nutrient uptake outer membrane protein [Flavobacterium nackdongense]